MPLCAQCGVDHGPCGGPTAIGSAKADCKTTTGAIWVHVMDDAGNYIAGVDVSKDGSGKNTDNGGVATFNDLAPGKYSVNLPPLSAQIKADYEPPKGKTTSKETVKAGVVTYVTYTVTRKAALKVKVVSKDGSTLFSGAAVEGTGPEAVSGKVTGGNGIADCLKVTPGKYEFKVTLKKADEDDWATTLDFQKKDRAEITLAPGDDKELVIQVEKKNEVTPKLELEYCVVLLESKLHSKQSGEAKIHTSPTYVEVSLDQTNKQDHPFAKGATLTCTPANVEIFTDEDLTKKVSGGKLKKELLEGDDPLKLYLVGVTAGKFKAKVKLDDPEDRFIKLKDDPTPEQDMGVVKLEMKVHRQDMAALKASTMDVDPDTNPEDTYFTNLDAKVMPPQKLMTDSEKVGTSSKSDGSKPGRLLHLQNAGSFGRARVLLAKLDGTHLPAAADAYEIVLNTGKGHAESSVKSKELMGGANDTPDSGALIVFDTEFGGAAQNPAKITIAQLKAAEKEFFVEGSTETDRTCDIRLDAGMDRAAGGLVKTIKRNGDWARFTVVKIKEVKVKYTPKAGKPNQWDAGQNRFHVNLKKDPSGRNIDIEAELNKPFKGIVLHFMLAPDRGNKKTANWGIDLPATWPWGTVTKDVKHKDKAKRAAFLHLSEKTDSDGKAKKTLVLSRFGGDVFWPACYIEEDAHLAKYVDGHAQLGTKVPVRATSSVTVWRKFWYQLINVAGVANPGVAGAVGQYDRIKAEMAAATPKQMTAQDATNANALYPRYMIELNGGNANALVISNKNKKKFFSGISSEADKPIKVPILIGDAQWDTGPDGNAADTPWIAGAGPVNIKMDRLALKPPLQGGKLLVSGLIRYRYDDAANPGNKVNPAPIKLTDAMVDIDPARDKLKKVRITPPAAVTQALANHPSTEYKVEGLVVRGAKGPYLGESFDKKVLAVYEPTEPVDFQNTIAHELGHGFGQTLAAGSQPNGIPAHPNQYISYDADGMSTGSHCNKDTDKCVMYQSGPIAGSHNRYCDVCHPYMLVHDLAKYG